MSYATLRKALSEPPAARSVTLVLVILLFSSFTATPVFSKPTDEDHCKAAFENAAGIYMGCRLNAEAQNAKKPDASKRSTRLNVCASNLAKKLATAQARWGAACRDVEPTAAVGFLDRCSDKVSDVAEGGNPRDAPLLATGQTTCWDTSGVVIPCAGTGQDGEIRAGAPLAYQDNGDGTVTDLNTGLVWEKLDDNNMGGIHDKDAQYTGQVESYGFKLAALNTPPCFASYCDWRLPNIRELQSLANYENLIPRVSSAFNSGCVPGCSLVTCSCTADLSYVSSTTLARRPEVMFLFFGHGGTGFTTKFNTGQVRAVRGGL